MHKTSIFVASLPLPPTSISLGRLIVNPKSPSDGSFDPSEKLPSKPSPPSDKSEIRNIVALLEKAKGGNIEVALSSFAKGLLGGERSKALALSACRGMHYFLTNSDDWFEQICADEATQSWLERQKMRGKRVYMVTACRTLVDATFENNTSSSMSAGVGAQVPTMAAAGIPAPSPLDVSANIEASSSQSRGLVLEFPGEKVFSIFVRELKLSKGPEKKLQPTLSPKTKWAEIYSVLDAGDLEDDDDDDEVMVQATLEDEIAPLEGCEAFETEDEVYYFEVGTVTG